MRKQKMRKSKRQTRHSTLRHRQHFMESKGFSKLGLVAWKLVKSNQKMANYVVTYGDGCKERFVLKERSPDFDPSKFE